MSKMLCCDLELANWGILEQQVSQLTRVHMSCLLHSLGADPLFYVESDEELDISVDEIYSDPETRTGAYSDASTTAGLISSISSHGSPEIIENFDISGSVPGIKSGSAESLEETLHPGKKEIKADTTCQIDIKMGHLNVEDDQEGTVNALFQSTLFIILQQGFQNVLK